MSATGGAADAMERPQALPYPADSVTGLLVRAVLPVEFGCWARYRGDASPLPVLAWADCVRPTGEWAGLLPIVPADRATGTIANPKQGFTGISFPGTAYR